MDGKVKGSAIVKITPFTLRKSNLASQRIFCTFINCALKIKRDGGAPCESRGPSAAAALWLPSPTRQTVKLKTGDEQNTDSETSSE